MAMLTCPHHVMWVRRIDGGKHLCTYCKSVVAKKDIYPKFDDLGEEFQATWNAHEAKGPPAPTPAPAKH